MQDGKKLLLASTRVQFLGDTTDQPDGVGGAGRMGKSDSRLGESMIFEERTMLKISTTKGGVVGLDFEQWGPSYYKKNKPKSNRAPILSRDEIYFNGVWGQPQNIMY